MLEKLKRVKQDYQTTIASINDDLRNKILLELADELNQSIDNILIENQKDLSRMDISNPKYDRLKLTKDRIIGIADDLKRVAAMKSPLNNILSTTKRDNGLLLHKISVPLGIIGIIYESRPNVTIDVFSLCFKSGNACILKGSSEALASNEILVSLIHKVLLRHNVSPNFAYLMPPERQYVYDLLGAVGIVDVCIPRGSQELINFVRTNAKVPVIETGAGIVHTYFDKSGDLTKGALIINNAKTRRVSVCNALDTLVVHEERLPDLPLLVKPLIANKVQIFADKQSYLALSNHYPADLLFKADDSSFGTEFLDHKMSIKTVASIEDAVSHIMHYTSHHSEAIISEDKLAIEYFMRNIDAAAVYANASTAFTDGGEFGMGAEIGISTQKLHARGPMGLNELTSYKWLIYGDGQTR
jgi:glutamate-5-semialdehyde dehydrogenase